MREVSACPNRILIAAPSSGGGKTTITCGLIAAMKRKGKRVVSFKCGPDYIDPMFHRQVLGIESGNLDTYFTDYDTTSYILANGSREADITIIEGVMGYYDGLGGVSTTASAYELARQTKTPVILVVDGKGSSVTLAALINGIKNFRKDSNIAGVILNRVSKAYYSRIRDVILAECKIPVLGFLPVMDSLTIPSRHLGLVAPEEVWEFDRWINDVCDAVCENIDVDAVLELAAGAQKLEYSALKLPDNICDKESLNQEHIRIAVARDEAFSFYYAENIDILERLVAEIIYFSPLHDNKLPDNIHGLILWGGYPENYADKLSANKSMRDSIYEACRDGMPCIAECGGFLYLGRRLEGTDGETYDMAGVLDGEGYRTGRLVRFGYMEAKANGIHDGISLLFGNDCHMRGHEFHYWDSTDCGSSFSAWKPLTPDKTYSCIIHTPSLIAGFPHFYYYSNPEAICSYIDKCKEYMHKNGR